MSDPSDPNPWRLFHLGWEFAGAILVMTAIGWWVDSKWQTGPWGIVTGVTMGSIGGLYLLIKEAMDANRDD